MSPNKVANLDAWGTSNQKNKNKISIWHHRSGNPRKSQVNNTEKYIVLILKLYQRKTYGVFS